MMHPGAPKEKTREKTGDERDTTGATEETYGALPADLAALLARIDYTVGGERNKLLALWERDRRVVEQAAHDAKNARKPSGWLHAWLRNSEVPAPKAPSPCPPCTDCGVGATGEDGRCLHAADCPQVTDREAVGTRDPGGGA